MTDAEVIAAAEKAGCRRPRIIHKKLLSDVMVRQLLFGPDDARKIIVVPSDTNVVEMLELIAG